MNRREFIQTSALAAMSGLTGAAGASPTDKKGMRAYMIQLGTRMWTKKGLKPSLDFNSAEWTKVTERAAVTGMNTLLVDLAEGVKWASHPEIGIPGSWTPARLKMELKRIRGLGLEPVPKLNFSTTHDLWLGPYERMVSTPKYYEVCSDLIKEACDLFDGPRFFHLGYDEEGVRHQEVEGYDMMIIRQRELWWHDFLKSVGIVEGCGARAWIWSDKYWTEPEEFLQRMPKSVLQSVWYYDASFDIVELKTHEQEELAKESRRLVNWKRVQSFLDLDKSGFEQVPCGSNWACDENFGNLVRFCRAHLDPSRVRGFLMAPWKNTTPDETAGQFAALELARQAL